MRVRSILQVSLLAVLATSALASSASAHGSVFEPPTRLDPGTGVRPPDPPAGDDVTPLGQPKGGLRPPKGSSDPSPGTTDPQPEDGGGPTTGPGGPTTAGGSGFPTAPNTPTTPNSPPPGSIPGTTTTGAAAPAYSSQSPAAPDLSLWWWWWEFNKDPFLAGRGRVDPEEAWTGSDGYFLGKGYRQRHTPLAAQPSSTELERVVVPALLEVLESKASDSLVASTLIALARVGEDLPSEVRSTISDRIRPYLADRSQEVSETTIVALGVLETDSGALVLNELLLDTPTGRRLVDRSSVGARMQAFAAYALGLIGERSRNEDVRRFIVHKLASAVEAGARDATPDVTVAAALALGRVPLVWANEDADGKPATTSREAQIAFLLERLDDKKSHRTLRAQIPCALAWLLTADRDRYVGPAREQVGRALLRLMDVRRRESRELRQGCVIALGRIGDDDTDDLDVDIRDALRKADSDQAVRYLALLSLGRTAGRSGPGPAGSVERDVRELVDTLARGSSQSARWAALGLAMFEHGRARAGVPGSASIREVLRDALDDARSPTDVAAFCIALGVVGDEEASERLLSTMRKSRDDGARGAAAVGLGLLGARQATTEIRMMVDSATYRPALLREGAIALGMLGDREVVPLLTDKLTSSHSLFAQAAVAQAIGRIGDVVAIEPLVALLRDHSRPDATRAVAAVALGLVADRDALPFGAAYAVDGNYFAAPPTLYDGVGFGLLNLL